jgi:hypothetical protein
MVGSAFLELLDQTVGGIFNGAATVATALALNAILKKT